jgi:cell division protein FtsN
MNSRYLSFLIILVFKGVISFSCPGIFSSIRKGIIINELSQSISSDVISVAKKWSFFSLSKLLLHSNAIELQDTVSKAKELVSEKPEQDFSPDMLIQVGAFLHESNALSLRQRLSDLLNKTVVIVPADGYFKVRITGFTSSEEMEKLIPALGLLGIKNIWVFRVKKKEDIISQVVIRNDTSLKAINDKINVSVVAEDKQVLAETTINLQVGVFHSRSEALRAQRRITTKLNLPVEIVKEWEYYIVFITGFKTRDEIFKYYPKLAALGYPDSFMIEINNVPVKKN